MTGTVLVVDDEAPVRFTIAEVLEAAGFIVREATNVDEALGRLEGVDVVVTDLVMPGKTGLDLLAAIRRDDWPIAVILLTARGDERTAVAAMKAGAWDYLTKPFDNDELGLTVGRAVERVQLLRGDRRRRAQNDLPGPIVGESPTFQRLLSAVERIGRRDINVLLWGETGTGKEAIASLVHAHSPRRNEPLIRFNCGAITESLANAELFGYVKGAFTGATRSHEGLFERAHRGTLVLDEVAELPDSVQSALLRVLQQGEVQPVGASSPKTVDVRVIACTHVPLPERVEKGCFRADLYYRLRVVQLDVPALRERRTDIPLLVRHFQRKYAERFGLSDVPLPQAVVAQLVERDWPGNVRELENAVAELLAFSEDGQVAALELVGDWSKRETKSDEGGSLRERVARFEQQLIREALDASGGNQSQAARRLSTTRTTLIDKMKRFGLT